MPQEGSWQCAQDVPGECVAIVCLSATMGLLAGERRYLFQPQPLCWQHFSSHHYLLMQDEGGSFAGLLSKPLLGAWMFFASMVWYLGAGGCLVPSICAMYDYAPSALCHILYL